MMKNDVIKIALAGNPNCGKTTLFNSLTGSNAHVGNWPGVTVDKREGVYNKLDEPLYLVDLPGIYSLSPYTPEEIIARNFILDEHPTCVINVVDATNLERNLYLTTQLQEMNIPIVIALNMIDEVEKHNDSIDIEQLSKTLGVKIVPVSALKRGNIHQLMNVVYQEIQERRQNNDKETAHSLLSNTNLSPLIDEIKDEFMKKSIQNPLFHAIKLIENDSIEVENHSKLLPIIEKFKENYDVPILGNDFEAIIADKRYTFITENCSPCYKKHSEEPEIEEEEATLSVENNGKKVKKKKKRDSHESISNRIDNVLTSKIWGLPIFILILFAIFHLTFSEDILFLGAMGVKFNNSFEGSIYEGLFWTEGGINSPGVILTNLVSMSTDALTDVTKDSMMGANVQYWCVSLVTDGVFTGIFSVIGFFPQILVLFLFFSILEDTGYMARICFMLDRIFRKLGLSGRAFIPMIMGFGCSVPAMINTRTLANEKEKIATLRVIPFFTCGAKVPILTAVSGALVSSFGIPNQDIVVYGMYLLGIVTALVSVALMKNTTLRGETPPFIMELPSYHTPQFKALMIHLWDKTKHFLSKAFTIIFLSNLVIWFTTSFGFNWMPLFEEVAIDAESTMWITRTENSILGNLGKLIQPFFTPLGFGSQLNQFGWVFSVCAIMGLIAKENVITSLSVLSAVTSQSLIPIEIEGDGGVQAVITVIQNTGISLPGCLAFIAFNLLTIPCFAAVTAAKGELQKDRFITTVLFWFATSYIVATMIYLMGEFAWTTAIFIPLIIAAIVGVYFYNRNATKKEREGVK